MRFSWPGMKVALRMKLFKTYVQVKRRIRLLMVGISERPLLIISTVAALSQNNKIIIEERNTIPLIAKQGPEAQI